MTHRLVAWTSIGVAVGLLTACSRAPSAGAIDRAVEQLAAAPEPADTAVDPFPDAHVWDGDPVDGSSALRAELCSDRSCPFLYQWYSPIAYENLAGACAALSDWLRDVGGTGDGACPPGAAASVAESGGSGSRARRTETGVVVVPDGPYGNSVLWEITHDVDDDGVPSERRVDMRLGIGEQFCSDSAVAQACVSGDS